MAPAQALFGVVVLFLRAAQKTYDAYEMVAETFEKLYLFILRLHDSLSAKLITSTMMETYALVVIDVFKIVLLATRYAQMGNSMHSRIATDFRILLESYIRSTRRSIQTHRSIQSIRSPRDRFTSFSNLLSP